MVLQMAVSRLRLKDLLESRLPTILGVCQSNWPAVADIVNAAQERLLTCREAGDTGWHGSYAELAMNVSAESPYLVLPREVARLISVDACTCPIEIHNQWYEYLQFGSGRWPKVTCCSSGSACARTQGYRRSTVCTFSDIATTNKFLRIYPMEPADINKRVLVGCRDANGLTQQMLDGPTQVQGIFVYLASPFVDLKYPGTSIPLELSAVTAIQKDITLGSLSFYEVDITTGTQRLLLTMAPTETIAAYECYYIRDLPQGCCCAPGSTDATLVQLTAMVKLDLIPAVVDSDYLLIQSAEAIIAEAQAGRLSDMDSAAAKVQAIERHRAAVRFLQGQLVHYSGKENIAVSFAPFGSARLENQKIGSLI